MIIERLKPGFKVYPIDGDTIVGLCRLNISGVDYKALYNAEVT